MALIRPTAVTSARTPVPGRGPVRYEHVPRSAPEPSVPSVFTRDQLDILAFGYQEEVRRGRDCVVAVIPANARAALPSRMYADARVLELGSLVSLDTPGHERVGEAPRRKAPWHYVWEVRLTERGRRVVQEGIGARMAASLPTRALRETARRAVPDPSWDGTEASAPGTTPVPAPRPVPVVEHIPAQKIPTETETEFVFT